MTTQLIETLYYSGYTVEFVRTRQKKKDAIWILIDRRPITFVSSLDTAKRIACKFIDVVNGVEFMESRQGNHIGMGFYGNS